MNNTQSGKKSWLYLSLWNEHGGAPGLVLFEFNTDTGETRFAEQLDDKTSFNHSYADRERGLLYVCNETDKIWGAPYDTGRIFVYRADPETGRLSELRSLYTYCPNPSYVSVSEDRRFMFVSNHSNASAFARPRKDENGEYAPNPVYQDALVEVFALDADGLPEKLSDIQNHGGKPGRHHPHCAVLSPDGAFLAVNDKGDGQLYLYAVNGGDGTLSLKSKIQTDPAGSPPRYCVFHPTLPYITVNHEQMKGGKMPLSLIRYAADGRTELVSVTDTLPEGCEAPPNARFEQQGMCRSADGKYVYTLLRGPNLIAVAEFSETKTALAENVTLTESVTLSETENADGEKTASLSVIQRVPIDGEWPRGLQISPDGRFIVASCLVSGDIYSYAVGNDGRLTPTGFSAKARGGACMSFFYG